MDTARIKALEGKVLKGADLSFLEADEFLSINQGQLPQLFAASEKIRRHFRGNRVSLCSITSAKSGNCPEDCAFCSQSSHHNTNIATHPLISLSQILEKADSAFREKADRFCIVISGRGIESKEELDTICQALATIKKKYPQLKRDASLGSLNEEIAGKLKQAGLERYNHNLETTEKFFSSVCTTHTYYDRLKTIRILKKLEIEVCCGGIFGLGETERDRIEFAFILKALDVDCLPINFLNPIPGTRFADKGPLEAWQLLKMVAIYRFILPHKEIRICGGRQSNLGESQSLIFSAGADAIISGNYLTTKGSPSEEDIAMIHRQGLSIKRE